MWAWRPRGALVVGGRFVPAGSARAGGGGEKRAGERIPRPTRRPLRPDTRLIDFPWADRCQHVHFGANLRVAAG